MHAIKDWKTFIKAGRAIFTIENALTGTRFTFKVNKKDNKSLWFVSVLSGPDNQHSYRYIGTIFDEEFKITKKSTVAPSAQSYLAFKWLNTILHSDKQLPDTVKFYHEDHCGRCGKLLTVPESIETGFGPECQQVLGIQAVSGHIDIPTAKKINALRKLDSRLQIVTDLLLQSE